MQFGYRYANTTEFAQLFTNGGMIFQNGGNFPVDYGAASFIANHVGITDNPSQGFFRAVGFAEQDRFSPTVVNAMYVAYGDSFMMGAAFTGNIHDKERAQRYHRQLAGSRFRCSRTGNASGLRHEHCRARHRAAPPEPVTRNPRWQT